MLECRRSLKAAVVIFSRAYPSNVACKVGVRRLVAGLPDERILALVQPVKQLYPSSRVVSILAGEFVLVTYRHVCTPGHLL